ncbi:sulfurtransferase TusA family protein [Actinobacillus pleuropneumoniae]|uniref:sulfurtransferase TusA family protein n=1 Tax=Actinobacillus pleuropneumoniae TaxID=715 RepID=UPI001F490E57|nr:sulfurtransferase TusA family protein [Actinobacillus pleuropneumoniae]UKH16253.1 sulfurtransferase TusA family protein [Actinobacillus pleuropneumoniae]
MIKTYQLDLRQYRCPLPLLMTKKALNQLALNERLVLLLDLASSVQDFELLCEEYGYELVQDTQISRYYSLSIRKK